MHRSVVFTCQSPRDFSFLSSPRASSIRFVLKCDDASTVFLSARKRETRMTPSLATTHLPSTVAACFSFDAPSLSPTILRFCQLCASIPPFPPFLRRYYRYHSYSDQLAPILFSFALDQLRSTAHVRLPEDTRYARGTKKRPIRAAIRASERSHCCLLFNRSDNGAGSTHRWASKLQRR